MSSRVIFMAFNAACGLLLGLAGICEAGPVVNGDLTDWGVTNSTLSSWNAAVINDGRRRFMTYGDFEFDFVREDQNDTAGDGGFLGPNHGGQNYDTEFLAAGVANNMLYIAIVTGQRRDNGDMRFSPGDIYIETTDFAIYGVEVGGGYGNTSATNVKVRGTARSLADAGFTSDPGSTYHLDSNGFTKTPITNGHTSSDQVAALPAHVAGSVWKTEKSDWILDPIATGTPDHTWPLPGDTVGKDPVQLQLNGGDWVGQAEYYYNMKDTLGKVGSPLLAQKAVIELSIPMSVFGGALIKGITWGPSCGNDILHLPEPATFGMLLMGALGFAGLRRARRNGA